MFQTQLPNPNSTYTCMSNLVAAPRTQDGPSFDSKVVWKGNTADCGRDTTGWALQSYVAETSLLRCGAADHDNASGATPSYLGLARRCVLHDPCTLASRQSLENHQSISGQVPRGHGPTGGWLFYL